MLIPPPGPLRKGEKKVAVIGHVVPTLPALKAKTSEVWGYRYNRVAVDGLLVDHLAYLGQTLGQPLCVWDMYLCAPLLLASHLRRGGHQVLLVNHVDSTNQAIQMERLSEFDPQVVAFSTTFILSARQMIAACKLLRRHLPDTFIVAGGHHVFTALMYMDEAQRQDYLRQCGLDALVNDVQGEATLLRLVEAFPQHVERVPNLIVRRADGTIVSTAKAVENNDINQDAPLDFTDIPRGSVVHVRTARSCSFKCEFCSYPTIAGSLALMDVDLAVDTLRRARAAEVAAVVFTDDTFNVPKPRFKKLLDRMIAEDLGLPWYSFLRCHLLDAELVEKIARAGCRGVFLGIESGSDAVLANMAKHSTTSDYRNGIHWLRQAGVMTVGSFVVGFPGETAATVAETAAFLQDSELDYYFLQPFYYLHHTPIHARAEQFGLKGSGLLWSHATMDWRQASAHTDDLFLLPKAPLAVHVDYNMWEIAYLQCRGFDRAAIDDYRRRINQMTADQLLTARGSVSC